MLSYPNERADLLIQGLQRELSVQTKQVNLPQINQINGDLNVTNYF